MPAGKVTKGTAEATLEGLSRIGEGWHLSVATAIAENKHKALGMERREFVAAAGGFRLADARQAILDLHERKLSQAAIADVLGVGSELVARVLYEEGRTARLPKRADLDAKRERDQARRSAGGARDDAADSVGAAHDELEERVETLELELRAQAKRAEEALEEERRGKRELARKLREAAQAQMRAEEEAKTEQERLREHYENEAAVEEATGPVRSMRAGLATNNVVSLLNQAREELAPIVSELSEEQVAKIDAAADAFTQELAVARSMRGASNG